ncbi:hypothetical protein [Yinghuangia seranimata]|uniref:hypothetical protein n=1 Tax=Yinghuangia seranimata TaxID=408067 RepID=UPI00248CEA37|nr:hypothetical protein [Yinghuangia seranimata]MDI2129725.1 hypothetical protein [Yinghuangia seranimata]
MVLRVPETPEHAREAVREVLDTPRRRATPAQDSAEPGEPDVPDALPPSGFDPAVPPEVLRATIAAGSVLRGGRFTAVCPHRMFEIDLADLARGVDAARPVGWRWLVHDAGHTVGAVEVADVGTGRPVARFTEGPFTTCTDAAVASIRGLPQIERGYYELRLLHIPGLYTVALWLADLAGLSGRQDLLVPLAPAPPGVQALRAYPAAELTQSLAARGRQLLVQP